MTKWGELNDRIARLSVTESSRDGMCVRVTVSTSGVLTGLVLNEWRDQTQPLGGSARALEQRDKALAYGPSGDTVTQAALVLNWGSGTPEVPI